jgi:hypothetical protein
MCKNPSTAVERIFNGFLLAGFQFIAIILRVGNDIVGTFLLSLSYVMLLYYSCDIKNNNSNNIKILLLLLYHIIIIL